MRLERKRGFHRILAYGAPKGGKTRFITSLPYDKWGKGLYIAADMGSEALAGVLDYAVDNLIIEGFDRSAGANLHKQAMAMATRDWVGEEGVGVIIWDTLTQTAKDLLDYYPRIAGVGKRVSQGVPNTPEWVVQADKPDYGMAQAACDGITRFLFQQQCHVIVVCHQAFLKPGAGDIGGVIGGPATAGSAQIAEFGRPFTAMLHLEANRRGGDCEYKVFTKPHSIWQAGVRATVPIPDTVLQPDPVHFWHDFIKATEV